MSTTVATILLRALDRNVETRGASITPTDAVLLWRVQQDQSAIYKRLLRMNRSFTLERVAVTSSSGASGRTVSLSALSPACEFVLKLEITASGVEVAQVDATDTDAELAPRYYADTNALVEVGADWSAASGTVGLTLTYLSLPAALNLAGATSQTVSLPDEWCDLLDNRLAKYLARKDAGRGEVDIAALDAEYEARFSDLVQSLSQPLVVRRFILPPAREDAT